MADITDEKTLHQIALSNLQELLMPQEQQQSVVYLGGVLQAAGPVRVGNAVVNASDPSVVLFIDQKPGANWMHPCRYLLVSPSSGSVVSVDADQPPAFGPLPVPWSVLWRAPGVEDWRLLPLAAKNQE